MGLRFELETITMHGETAIGSTESTPLEDKKLLAIVKSPTLDWQWSIYEAEFQGDEILFFGLVDGFASEHGYFTLSDLETEGADCFVSFNGVTHEIEQEDLIEAEGF